MQITKFLMILCTAVTGAVLISARAEDNPAQAAARAALMGNTSGWANPATAPKNPTPPPMENHPAPVVTNAPAAVVDAEPATTIPPASTMSPATATSSSDTEAQAKARAALEQRMQAWNMQPSAATSSQPNAGTSTIVVQKNSGTGASAAKTAALANANTSSNDAMMAPIMAPDLPIAPGKQMQLDVLLTKYKADQVSPEEYQKRRAAILAQP